MEQALKERLVGAAILFTIAIIFIPVILNNPVQENVSVEPNDYKNPVVDFIDQSSSTVESKKTHGLISNGVNNIGNLKSDSQKALMLNDDNDQQHAENQQDSASNKETEVDAVEDLDNPVLMEQKTTTNSIAQGTLATDEKVGHTASSSTDEKVRHTASSSTDEKVGHTVNSSTDEKVGPTASSSTWVIQLGSFSSKENAQRLNQKLLQLGFAGFLEPFTRYGKTHYKVKVMPEHEEVDVKLLLKDIKEKLGIDGIIAPQL